MNDHRTPSFPLAWVLASLVLGLALAVPMAGCKLFDDAYIHARLAGNLLAHGSPSFNPGEPFKAGSSTGYLFLIAALARPFGLPGAIRALEMLAIATTTTGLAYLAGLSQHHRARSVLAALTALPYFLLAAYGGMETPIVCLLLTAAAIAWHHRRDGLVVALVALCVWFRFEALLLLAAVLFHYLRAGRRPAGLLLYATPVLLLFATELALYGSIVPHAAKVKSIAYGLPLEDSVYNALSFGNGWRGLLIGLFLATVLVARVPAVLRAGFALGIADVFLVFVAGILAAWAASRSLIFPWYYCLLTFPLGLAVLLSDEPVAERAGKTLTGLRIAMLAGLAVFGSKTVLAQFGLYNHDDSNLRVERYMTIGSQLYAACPDCTLVTSEIGGLGYSFKGKVYDAFGLGDPQAVRFHPMKVPEERQDYGTGAIPPGYVVFRRPDFVVSMPVFSQALRQSEVIRAFTAYDCPFGPGVGPIFGDDTVQVFSRVPLREPVVAAMGCVPAGRPSALSDSSPTH